MSIRISFAPLRNLPHGKYICQLSAHSLCFLITDLLPVSALFPANVICYILLYLATAHLTVSCFVSLCLYCRSFDISQHLCQIILLTSYQHGIKYFNQFSLISKIHVLNISKLSSLLLNLNGCLENSMPL